MKPSINRNGQGWVRRTLPRWILAAVFSGSLYGCATEENRIILVVQAAADQPQDPKLGLILAIQALGGKLIEVEVTGGSLPGAVTEVCLVVPETSDLRDAVLNQIVYPTGEEAVVTVRLYAGTEDGASGSGGGCGTDDEPLRQVIRPIGGVEESMGGAGGVGGEKP